MNTEIRDEWVAALNSGDYRQGQGYLRVTDDETGNDSYCCLGVLCDLAVSHGVIPPPVKSDYAYSYKYGITSDTFEGTLDRSSAHVPFAVQQWAGLNNESPVVYVPSDQGNRALTGLNDSGHSFSQIAELIGASL